jgi:hypothetical protein
MATEFVRGFIFAARRLWCGIVGHNFRGRHDDPNHMVCDRCNWCGGYRVMEVRSDAD